LLSMGQLCKASCTVMFDAASVNVHRDTELCLVVRQLHTCHRHLGHLRLVQALLAPVA
jgi:hypothetical protein